MSRRAYLIFAAILCVTLYFSCSNSTQEKTAIPENGVSAAASFGLEKLSEYGFFKGVMADLSPVDGILPYDLNTPLFSDYAHKARFVKVPQGQKAVYNPTNEFEFPVGTVLIKNFFYPNDFRDASKGRKIMETRLLIHEEAGWKALPYIWNEEQTEAVLEITGGRKDISWIHSDGSTKTVNYLVPNVNQCKGCHVRGDKMSPIGPSARQLNRDYIFAEGKANQLTKWRDAGILDALPENLADCPRVPDWENPTDGTTEQRARAYIDVNCAHCHSATGPANTSGLLLNIHETNPTHYGVYKTPVAAGRGSGNSLYSITPGKPDESILVYRMKSTDPGVMMPELGRKLVHEEGVKVVEEWIKGMKGEGR